jgi:hypothetical protein
MNNSDLNALYQELLDAVLRCQSNLWFCKTCRKVVFYDRRSQVPLGAHDAHQAVAIPTLYDPDEGCERGFLRGWLETDAGLAPERQATLLAELQESLLEVDEFIARQFDEEEREAYEQYRTGEGEALVLDLLAAS